MSSDITAEPERPSLTNARAKFDGLFGKNDDARRSSGDLVMADLDAPAERRRPLVLVIDDDADIRTAIQDLLEGEGFATAGAADGQAALNFLADSPDRPAGSSSTS